MEIRCHASSIITIRLYLNSCRYWISEKKRVFSVPILLSCFNKSINNLSLSWFYSEVKFINTKNCEFQVKTNLQFDKKELHHVPLCWRLWLQWSSIVLEYFLCIRQPSNWKQTGPNQKPRIFLGYEHFSRNFVQIKNDFLSLRL